MESRRVSAAAPSALLGREATGGLVVHILGLDPGVELSQGANDPFRVRLPRRSRTDAPHRIESPGALRSSRGGVRSRHRSASQCFQVRLGNLLDRVEPCGLIRGQATITATAPSAPSPNRLSNIHHKRCERRTGGSPDGTKTDRASSLGLVRRGSLSRSFCCRARLISGSFPVGRPWFVRRGPSGRSSGSVARLISGSFPMGRSSITWRLAIF